MCLSTEIPKHEKNPYVYEISLFLLRFMKTKWFSFIINIYKELRFSIPHSFVDRAGQEDALCISLVRLQTYTILVVMWAHVLFISSTATFEQF